MLEGNGYQYVTKGRDEINIIIALKEALGHSNVRTTLTYLHIAQLGRQRIFSPLDKLYEEDEQR